MPQHQYDDKGVKSAGRCCNWCRGSSFHSFSFIIIIIVLGRNENCMYWVQHCNFHELLIDIVPRRCRLESQSGIANLDYT